MRGSIGPRGRKLGLLLHVLPPTIRSPEYLGLSDSAKRVYRGLIETCRQEHGGKPVRMMQRRHVQNILAGKAGTRNAANILRKQLISLLDHAVLLDWRPDNPTKVTKPYRVETNGFHTWGEDDLLAVLEALPDDREFLATTRGAARSSNGLGNEMRKWCDKAGLPSCTSHGLRKACARRLAEAGATAHEIGAVTGHKTLSEVQRYTAEAPRGDMADAAFDKLIARPNGERNVSLSERFTKEPTK